MNDFRFLPDDPKLTAYALGELDEEERAEIEQALDNDPAARASVKEIRAMVEELETVLEMEAVPAAVPYIAVDPYSAAARRKAERFPQIIYLLGGLAAAGVAVMLALQKPSVRKPPEQTYYELNLPASNTSVAMVNPEDGHDAATGPGEVVMPSPDAENRQPATPPVPLGLLDQAKLFTRFTEPARGSFETVSWPVFQFRFNDPRSESALAARLNQRDRSEPRSANVNTALYQLGGRSRTTAGGAQVVLTGFNRSEARDSGTKFEWLSTESYAYRPESDFLAAEFSPRSTFSADVDTASYANVRRFIRNGTMPPVDAVRIEEMVNYFPYRYDAPRSGMDGEIPAPFAASLEVAAAPWAHGHRLVRIGLKGREVAMAERGAANLVFLIDVSGSMNAANKLPLVQESMRLLLARLRADDRVAIVTYAGATGLALPSTPVAKAREITAVLDQLQATGSTNGARGLQLAYDIAKANFVNGGINRVILCTDGDFNVGVTDDGGLVRLIEEKAKTSVALTVLGFGMGNLKDATMQRLADHGNGNYGYVDSRREAEKLLVQEVSGTLVTIAKDVKFQVEFNPDKVARYRLIGYEKRLLQAQDFNVDTVDAGEIGAGHTMTALYEIIPVGTEERDATTGGTMNELKYARVKSAGSIGSTTTAAQRDEAAGAFGGENASGSAIADELLTLTVRYKDPAGEESRKLEFALVDEGREFAQASDDFKFAAGVAGFGMILRDSPHKGSTTFAAVRSWAEAGMADDLGGYRSEFVELLRRAEALQ